MKIISLFILIGLCVTANAHVDKIITIEDHKLIGLPDEFQPAELNLEAKRLRIKNHEMIFPEYLDNLLAYEPYDLKITSSWYHTHSKIPPYLKLHIQPIDKEYHYQFLFNMNSLEIIEFSIGLRISEHTSRWFDVDLHEQDKKEFKESIRTINQTRSNQGLEAIVTTPVESGNVISTQPHP